MEDKYEQIQKIQIRMSMTVAILVVNSIVQIELVSPKDLGQPRF